MSHRPKSLKLARTLDKATRAAIDHQYPARVNGKRQKYKFDTTGYVDESMLAAIREHLDTRDPPDEPAPEPAVAVRGPRGRVGEIGPIGPQGKRGPAGKDGEDGEDGFNGLPGPKGEAGERGTRGPKGPKGDKGERGDRGFSGPPGAGIRGPRGRESPGQNNIMVGSGPPPEGGVVGQHIYVGSGEPDSGPLESWWDESE